MKIVLLGAPGSGKGTQAAFISEKYGLKHISTGDIFRDNIARKTPVGIKIKDIIDSGNLCPDELTIEIVKNRLSEDDVKAGYLLDGFPRNLNQAESLEKDNPPDLVLNIDVDLDLVQKRISSRRFCEKCKGTFNALLIENANVCPKCGAPLVTRKDDEESAVKERLVVYKKSTEPLIAYYKNLNKLVSVDGNKSIEEVFNEIIKVLDKQ